MFSKPIKHVKLDLNGATPRDYLMDLYQKAYPHKTIKPVAFPFMLDCLDEGGFIAGGFAERIAYGNIAHSFIKDRADVAFAYYLSHRGDVDIWFENSEASSAFLAKIRASNKFTETIPPEDMNTQFWAKTFHDKANLTLQGEQIKSWVSRQDPPSEPHGFGSPFKYQVIVRRAGSPEAIVNDFDIYNAMCYITKDGIYVPEHFAQLARRQELHMFKPDYGTLVKISKWFERHKLYSCLTEQSRSLLNDNFEALADDVIKGKLKHYGKLVKAGSFAGRLIARAFGLKPEFLVLLGMMCVPDEKYGYEISDENMLNQVKAALSHSQ